MPESAEINEFTPAKVLVTGGAGFIGSHLVDRLVADSFEVVVLDNFFRGRIENLAQSRASIRLIEGDIRDRHAIEKAMDGVHSVFHLAAQSSVLVAERNPDYAFETNVIGTYEVLRAARAAGVKRVVFSSSREVYGEPALLPVPETAPIAPKNTYGASKAAAEMYCLAAARTGLDVVVLRLANVYGPRDFGRVIPLFLEKVINGKPLTVFDGGKILDFLWIDDLVDAMVEAARIPCPATPLNVGCGKGTTLFDLAARVSSLTGIPPHVTESDNRSAEVTRFIADVSAAKSLLGLNCPEDPLAHLGRMAQDLANTPVPQFASAKAAAS